MSDLNQVIIIGRLGADPDTRYSANGAAITNCRIATSDKWKDKNGQQQERTEWHRVVFFNRLGEIAGEYLSKGRQVCVVGKLQTRKWTGDDGVDRYTTEIIADRLQMLGDRGEGGGQKQSASGGFRDSSSPRAAAKPQQEPDQGDFHDDDIPF